MRHNGVIAAGQALWQSLALLIVYRIGAQSAGVGTLGAWSTAVAVAGLVTLADLGLADVLVREVARARAVEDWARVKGLCRTVLRVVPLTVGVAGLAALPAVSYIIRAADPSLDEQIMFMVTSAAITSVWLTMLATAAGGVLEAFGRYDLKAIAALISGVSSIVVAWLVARSSPQVTIAVALVASVGVNMLLVLGAAYRLVSRLPQAPRPLSKQERNDLLRLGINARLGAVANMGFDPLVRFMLLRFGGSESAGLYEIAYRLVIQVRGVLAAGTQVIVPRLIQERARGTPAAAAVVQLTWSSLRLAGPALWGILLVLPLLSIALLARIDVEVLAYGLVLTIAWLMNAVAIPAYYGNFVEGALALNRTSHAVMLAMTALAGLPAGLYFGGPGVVVATSLAIVAGSAVILASRRHDFTGALGARRPEYLLNVAGLLCVAAVYGIATADVSSGVQVVVAAAACILYAIAFGPAIARLVQEHLRRIAGDMGGQGTTPLL